MILLMSHIFCFMDINTTKRREMRKGENKSSNLMLEGKFVLLTAEECDSSNMFTSKNQHLKRCCLLTTEGNGYKRSVQKSHTSH